MHVPGWHERTKELQEAGRLQMLGIVQEQNPDRAALFMQWKRMDWPILVDTFDQLEVSVVPLTFAIDEHGIVRLAGLRTAAAETIEEEFVDRRWPPPRETEPTARPGRDKLTALTTLAAQALRDPASLDGAIATLERWTSSQPDEGWHHFRLAAAHRLRYDSPHRRFDDFQRAVDHWQEALALDPNNYIWRRRIQQYGPRLDKPYPFYDWVDKAQREVLARGETPVLLVVPPSGSEIAQPTAAGADEPADPTLEFPDPLGRVVRDGRGRGGEALPGGPLVRVETTAVPRSVSPGATTRVHLVFRPDERQLAHWNNEVDPLRVWLQLPDGWNSSQPMASVVNPTDAAVSSEVRRVEFEIELPEPSTAGRAGERPHATALYYVCEDVDGTCLYRRQDVELDLRIDSTRQP